MGIFDKRISFKPFEYPEIIKYSEAIQHSYWLFSEFNYESDVTDFSIKLDENERLIIKKTLLAISQVEVSVKSFWGDIYKVFPKPEFNAVGAVFAESEQRHSFAYAHLLEKLGFNDEFENMLETTPAIRGRIEYLQEAMGGSKSTGRNYVLTLALFSLFIENVSLFSQFLIVKAFNYHKKVFRGIDNVIEATQEEEQLHALFGSYVINLVRKEHPEFFDEEFTQEIKKSCLKALNAECGIIDWIFSESELNFLPKDEVVNFIKSRFNWSLELIGLEPIFEVNEELIKKLNWFTTEKISETHSDFFARKPTSYNKKAISITADDLF